MRRLSFLLLVAFSAASVGETVRGGNPLFQRGDANQDGALDLLAGAFIVAQLSLQRAIAQAGFAVIFLAAFVVMSVTHHIRTFTS